MSNKNSTQIIAIVAIMSIVAIGILPKVIAQPSPNSNATMSSDKVEKLFAEAPKHPLTMAAGAVNKYSAWLFVCTVPPITNAETQCDTPVQLH